MAKKFDLTKKLGYEVLKREGVYWFYARQYSPACRNVSEKMRVNGPFDSKSQANDAAVLRYWNMVHEDPTMQQFLWTPN